EYEGVVRRAHTICRDTCSYPHICIHAWIQRPVGIWQVCFNQHSAGALIERLGMARYGAGKLPSGKFADGYGRRVAILDEGGQTLWRVGIYAKWCERGQRDNRRVGRRRCSRLRNQSAGIGITRSDDAVEGRQHYLRALQR